MLTRPLWPSYIETSSVHKNKRWQYILSRESLQRDAVGVIFHGLNINFHASLDGNVLHLYITQSKTGMHVRSLSLLVNFDIVSSL